MVQQQQQVLRRQRRAARNRKRWCRPWLLRRPAFGQFEQLMVELKVEDPMAFQNFVRFKPAMVQELVDRLTPLITKTDTNCCKALDPGLKLDITLRYLATGDSMVSEWLTIPFVCSSLVCVKRLWMTTMKRSLRHPQHHKIG